MAISLVVILAGAFGGIGTAWAAGPYFTALPEFGETEMRIARFHAVAALLPGGQVLIAGGENETGTLRSAEIFNPEDDVFTALPESGDTEMQVARQGAVAAPLPSGQVLIAGGENGSGGTGRSAELFNPTSDTFTALPESGETELHTARGRAVAVPLPNGQVLIAGGGGGSLEERLSAELFNPTTDTFALLPTSDETELSREAPAAAPLSSGQVLIVGGSGGIPRGYLGSAELFNPATDSFTAVPGGELALHLARYGATAAPLPSGQVLIAGGSSEPPIKSAELFNPSTGIFTALPESGETELQAERNGSVAALLPGGQVLIAGGALPGGFRPVRSAELFYAAPEALVAGGSFGDQMVGDPAGEQVVVVTNASPQPLLISGASLGGSDVGDFSMVADGCAHRTLELWQSCMITARFTPTTAGAREARIALFDNEPSPVGIVLRGTGVAANSGPIGPTGSAGPTGATGVAGANGLQGPAGANGAVGSQGPTGVAGPAGPAGKNGEVELVICKLVAAGTGKNRKTVQRCTIELTGSAVTITTARMPAAVLSRGGIVYATGSAVTGKKTRLLLTPRRHIDRGTYTLILTRGRRQQRETITIA